MNSDGLILRETTNPPLTNKGTFLDNADFDANFIAIYNDLLSLAFTASVDAYSALTTYDDTNNQFATYDGRTWMWINASSGSAVTPAEGIYWQEIFPAYLAHRKNSDTILDEGNANEVTSAEIRAFIDAGLTTTTDLSITTKTAFTFLLNSSTGANVTIPQATEVLAGLLGAAEQIKLNQLSGTNTGDQTLVSLNAEDVDNKATDFTTVNDTLYPSIQAVVTYVAAQLGAQNGLAEILATDNTTVGNDIIMTTTDKIKGSTTANFINFNDGSTDGIFTSLASGASTLRLIEAAGNWAHDLFLRLQAPVIEMWTESFNLRDTSSNFRAYFDTNSITADRTLTYQDATGTIALLADTKYEIYPVALTDESTPITASTSIARQSFRMPFGFEISSIRASLTGAGSSSGVTTIDIKEGGVSIFSTLLTIDFGETTSTTAATPAVISDTTIVDDADITVFITTVTGGSDEVGAKITFIGDRT